MLEDKDVKRLIMAMKEVFPTAEMINKSFNTVTTKEQFENLDTKVDRIEIELKEVKNSVGDHKQRIETLEHKVGYVENILNLPTK